MNPALLSDELARQRAITAVADMQRDAWRDLAETYKATLETLLVALAEAGIVVRGGEYGPFSDHEEHWWAEGRIVGTSTAAETLGEAIIAARRAVQP